MPDLSPADRDAAADGDLQVVTQPPRGANRRLLAGLLLGLVRLTAGIRIVTVSDSGISHRYYGLGELPNRVLVR